MGPEGIVTDLLHKVAVIHSCQKLEIPLNISPRSNQRTEALVASLAETSIPPYSTQSISVSIRGSPTALPSDRDLLFEPKHEFQGVSVFAHIVDCSMTKVIIRNDTDLPVTIKKNGHLDAIVEYDGEGYFFANPHDHDLAAIPAKLRKNQSWAKCSLQTLISAAAMLTAEDLTVNAPSVDALNAPTKILPNGVTIHGTSDSEAVHRLSEVVQAYPKLWEDHSNVANIAESDWMPIPLVNNWQSKYTCKAKVYPLGKADKDEVDKEFDKLQRTRKAGMV